MTNLLIIPAPVRITVEQEKFHQTFKHCGAKHREFRNKCISMLPRILEERIYEKKGFDSIGIYAGKLAGLSRAQVGLTLSLHGRFKDKPALKELLESGKVGLSKLARVASIATKENQEFLAGQALMLSQKALETLVRDLRAAQQAADTQSEGNLLAACTPTRNDSYKTPHENLFQSANGLYQPLNAPKFLRAQKVRQTRRSDSQSPNMQTETQVIPSKATNRQPAQPESQMAAPLKLTQLKLSAQNLEKLLELQEKGIDINQIITEALATREEEIARGKDKLSTEAHANPEKHRYVKVAIKQILKKEYGHKCAKSGCQNPATQTHHAERYAMSTVHDPLFMAPLCAEHHQIAHSIDIKYQRIKWRT